METISGAADSIQQFLNAAAIIDLSHELAPGMPVAPSHPGYVFNLARRHGDRPRTDQVCTANEVLVLSGHTGTHIDAIGHASRNGALFGGIDAAATQTGGLGLRALGAETIEPVLCRGILLDVARLHGVDHLAGGYEITADDLANAADLGGVQVQPGDAVLVRTGWTHFWPTVEAYVGAQTGAPGPGPDAAKWLVDRDIRLTGSDTIAYEVVRHGRDVRPVHGLLLVDAGIHIVEAMDLEELSRADRQEFVLALLPLRLVGATGSPVRPVAIFL